MWEHSEALGAGEEAEGAAGGLLRLKGLTYRSLLRIKVTLDNVGMI